jgi:transposase-like protein
LEVGQEAAEQVHKQNSQACAKNGGGADKAGSKPTVIHIKTGNVRLYNITLRRIRAITVAVEKYHIL